LTTQIKNVSGLHRDTKNTYQRRKINRNTCAQSLLHMLAFATVEYLPQYLPQLCCTAVL